MERTPILTKEFLLTKFNMLNIKYIFESFEPMNKYQEELYNKLQLYKKTLSNYNSTIHNISFNVSDNNDNILYKYYLDEYNSFKNKDIYNIQIKIAMICKNIKCINIEIKNLTFEEQYLEHKWRERCNF